MIPLLLLPCVHLALLRTLPYLTVLDLAGGVRPQASQERLQQQQYMRQHFIKQQQEERRRNAEQQQLQQQQQQQARQQWGGGNSIHDSPPLRQHSSSSTTPDKAQHLHSAPTRYVGFCPSVCLSVCPPVHRSVWFIFKLLS